MASRIAKAKGLRSILYAVTQRKHISSAHILLAVTKLKAPPNCKEAGECELPMCLGRREKLDVDEHCIPLLHVGG